MAYGNERGVREAVCHGFSETKGVTVHRSNGRAWLEFSGDELWYEVSVSVSKQETVDRVKREEAAAKAAAKQPGGRKPNNVAKQDVAVAAAKPVRSRSRKPQPQAELPERTPASE